MTDRMLSSQEPLLIELGLPATVSAARFSECYKDEPALITGADGASIEKVRLGTVYERWWETTEAADAAASAGHVVHWPLKRRCADELVAPVLREAERVIAALGSETFCVLDEFRRNETPHYLWAILGPAGSRVRAHQDMFGTASWNALLSGCKQWTFWAPHRCPEADPPCTRFEQRPGELVWIPENWWHRVTYDEPSLCMSKNLVLRRSLTTVRERVGQTEPALARHLAAVAAIDPFGSETQRSVVEISAALERDGFAVVDDLLPRAVFDNLDARVRASWRCGSGWKTRVKGPGTSRSLPLTSGDSLRQIAELVDRADDSSGDVFTYLYHQLHADRDESGLVRSIEEFALAAWRDVIENLVGHFDKTNFSLTAFNEGCRLARHTDHGGEIAYRLTMLLYFTSEGSSEVPLMFCGKTAPARIIPRPNRSVIFVPSVDTTHWIDPVSCEDECGARIAFSGWLI